MTTLILTALDQGINVKLLLIATGLDQNTFMKYVYDDLFSVAQRTAIKETIRDWKINS